MRQTGTLHAPMPQPLPWGWLFKSLLVDPQAVVAPYLQAELSHGSVFRKVFWFWLGVSLLFAITTVLYTPPGLVWTTWEQMLRFGYSLGLSLVVLVPLLTVVWALLQKGSAWFWNVQIPFITILGIAGLGLFYYALILCASLPVFLLVSADSIGMELALFALNLGALILSVRLFKWTYQTASGVSGKKATFISLFPLVMLGLAVVLTQVLTYFSVMHHGSR